jgi:NADH:ubiquinone oxidoreductase subunit F (NADH-binding)/(2Fe-2S) ferredoxin/Pyruvate/2-oxoacid:ferredoxin oxidoreductase delta subunit
MPNIISYENLLETYQEVKPLLNERLGIATPTATKMVLVCGDTGCLASDSAKIISEFQRLISEHGLKDTVKASIAGCFGFCEKGPIVKIFPDNTFYVSVTAKDVPEIFTKHLLQGQIVDRLLYEEPTSKEKIPASEDIPFYRGQKRIALRNCGVINPEKIEEYIANNGYQAVGKALTQMSPQDVIDTMLASGLRGRGGAGFITGKKWAIAKSFDAPEKFIICNADEGDPGAFMDRSIMEGDAHSVIEGMTLAGYAIGASKGYIYIRAEYPLAVKRVRNALTQAHAYGLLGNNILGSNFSFDIDIRLGAGAFVCGEETALIHSIEGSRGEPGTKPPFPAESGLWGCPTIVNNVETLANIPYIFLHGAQNYAAIGTETSKGTKVFALAGKVNNVGLVEVPMGTTLRQIIFDIGGGIKGGSNFKAAQTGGPSGGCIPSQFLDTPIDYQSLMSIGSMMGSGGMIVLNDDDCMVNIARFYLEFSVEESCGRCAPCRIGNKRLLEILTDITEGRGTEADLMELSELSQTIMDTALCGLGQSSPNPVISTMKYFWEEYQAHVIEKRCPAGVCQKLLHYEVIAEKCIGCTACARVCPVTCISGTVKQPHIIDQSRCIKCGACMSKCKFSAISRN